MATNWRKYGLEPIAGTHGAHGARQFRDVDTGETVSRRQAENRRIIDEAGWDSWSQWQRTTSPTAHETSTSRRWQHFADISVQEGENASRADARKANSDFNAAYNDWRKTGYERGTSGKGYASDPRNRPHGPYAKFLEQAGLRPHGANYAVGGSPGRKR